MMPAPSFRRAQVTSLGSMSFEMKEEEPATTATLSFVFHPRMMRLSPLRDGPANLAVPTPSPPPARRG
jgi:hypothetical protein